MTGPRALDELEDALTRGEDVDDAEIEAAHVAVERQGLVARLRARAAERRAVTDAARAQEQRDAAAVAAARQAVAPVGAGAVTAKYDAAVAALADLVDILERRRSVLYDIATKPRDQLPPGAHVDTHGAPRVPIGGEVWTPVDLQEVVTLALVNARVARLSSGRYVLATDEQHQAWGDQVPEIVREGRA